jgi:hypothetical protein
MMMSFSLERDIEIDLGRSKRDLMAYLSEGERLEGE